MDNKEKFTGRAEAYENARPGYASALIDNLTGRISKSAVIADIGSGTGKLAAAFLKRGYKVFCVEPNADMRNMAKKMLAQYSGFTPINGTDVNSALSSNSVDLVTVAQAFHWFDADGFKRECKRILKPGGLTAIIYNHRAEDSRVTVENAEIFKKYCPDFKGFSNKLNADARTKIAYLFDGEYETLTFNNDLVYNKETFINRALSASYSLTENDIMYSEYLSKLEALFEKYSKDNTLTVQNRTFAYVGTIK